MTDSLILIGFLASLAAGLATVLGAVPLLAVGRPSDRQQYLMLGFAAGVMIAASFLSLIIPGIDQAQLHGATKVEAAATVIAAVLLGALAIGTLNQRLPPLDRLGLAPTGAAVVMHRRVWLFVAAITLHNLPEGLAVGVSFGTGDLGTGTATALGIGLQNIPEGLAVAAALATIGYSARASVLAALLSGLVEPVGGLIGVGLVTIAAVLLPWGLGFAAGAMLYVVTSEIIPQAHEHGEGAIATRGLMVGLAVMMFLDVTLG